MTRKQQTISLKQFLGLNLKLDPMEFGRENWQTKATDIDITDNNRVRTRRGQVQFRANAGRSLWGNRYFMTLTQDSSLMMFKEDLSTAVPSEIRADMHPSNPTAYVDVGEETYYTDGRVNGKFVQRDHTDWAVEEPPGLPTLTATEGALYEGCHWLNITYKHKDGRESGCGESAKIELGPASGIALSAIPQPNTPDIDRVVVYLSEANGLKLFQVADLPVGATTHTITNRAGTQDLMTQFMRPPPVGNYLAFSGSRVWVAVDRFLIGSLPFTYHLFDFRKDYMVFAEPIQMLAYTTTGIFVSAERLFFVSTIEENWVRKEVSQYKAVPGTVTYMDGQDLVDQGVDVRLPVWAQQNGIVVGLPDGTVKNLTENKIDIGASQSGASLMKKEKGLSQVVTSLLPGTGASIHASDTVIAEVKTRGITIS